MLVLYYKTSCPYCLRARLVLAEKELPFERRIVGKEKPPELDELSSGKVPVLLEDSLAVRDSTVIAEYLEDRFPTPALLSSEARFRAVIRMAMVDIENRLMGPLEKLVHEPPEDEERARKLILEAFEPWEAKLGDAGMLFGAEHTLADIWLFVAAELAKTIGIDASRAGPNLSRWLERMGDRKSARRERLTPDT